MSQFSFLTEPEQQLDRCDPEKFIDPSEDQGKKYRTGKLRKGQII